MSDNKLTWREVRILSSTLFTVMFISMVFSLQSPFFPAEAEAKGVSPTEYGFVFGVYDLCTLIGSLFSSYVISCAGVKLTFLSGSFIAGGCCALFGMLSFISNSVTFLASAFILRIFEGFAQAFGSVAVLTILMTEFRHMMGFVFACQQTVFTVGMCIGPSIGGILYDIGGFYLPFAVVAGMIYIGAILSCCFIQLTKAEDKIKHDHSVLSLFRLFHIWIGVASTALACFTSTFISTTLEPHLRPLELSGKQLGLIFLLLSGCNAMSCLLWGVILDRGVHPRIVMMVGSKFMVVSLLFIGQFPRLIGGPVQLWYVLVGVTLLGIGQGGMFTPGLVDIIRVAKINNMEDNQETSSLCNSVWLFSFSLGGAVGPSAAGILYDTIGFSNNCVFLGTLILVYQLVVVTVHVVDAYKKNKESISDETPLLHSP